MEIFQKYYRKLINDSFIRYLFVGVTTVAIDFGLLVLLHGKLEVHISLAASIAYWISIAYNFTLNRLWTFSVSDKAGLKKHLLLYSLLLGINYLFTVFFVTIASRHIDYTIAKVLAIVFQIVWTYPIYKYVIFKSPKKSDDNDLFIVVMKWIVKNRYYLLALFGLIIASILIVFSRSPQTFLHPQLWAEEGRYWYADAYNLGPIRSLIIPYASSLQFATRLIGSIALILPLKFVPTFFLLAAVVFQIAPVILINTRRFRGLIPNVYVRLFICFCYLAIPNSFEVHANLTNANWHIALLAFMVLVGPTSKNIAWKLFDFAMILLAGLTGPFAIVLAAITLLHRYFLNKKEKRDFRIHTALILFCAAVQVVVLLVSEPSNRFTQGLAATPELLLSIIGTRIGASGMLGMETVNTYLYPTLVSPIFWIFSAYIGIVLLIALWKGPLALKLFILFTWGIFLGALLKPQASDTIPQWPAMIMGAGNRYFFLPTLSWLIASIWLVTFARIRALQVLLAIPILCLVFIAIPKDWRYKQQWPQRNFAEQAKQFNIAPSGQRVCILINPDWDMCLNKR